ncbi:MAG: nucleoside recognition protein [Clostridiales bacterium]|jgi:hypothetical protein|nr:nucleoside recognition protein [Clostridiales bacterium]
MVIIILSDALLKSLTTIFYFVLILIPIMVAVEYANHFQLLEKWASFLGWLPRSLNMSPQAAFPLLVGLFLGVFYGAAVIIEYTRQGTLNKRDIMLSGVFLAINHSIIEDNLLMAAVGANLLILFPIRFIMAFLVTRAAGYYYDSKIAHQMVGDTEPKAAD